MEFIVNKIIKMDHFNFKISALKFLGIFIFLVILPIYLISFLVASDTANTTLTLTVTPLSPPANLSGQALNSSSIELSWTEGVNAASYKLYRDDVEITTTSSRDYTDLDLNAGTSYTYKIRSINQYGGMSILSSPLVVQTHVQNVPMIPTSIGVSGSQQNALSFKIFGHGYPHGEVYLTLYDNKGKIINEYTSEVTSSGYFEFSFFNLLEEISKFDVYGVDNYRISSKKLTYSLNSILTGQENSTLKTFEIFLPPTINISKSVFEQGDKVSFFGQGVPNSFVIVKLLSGQLEKNLIKMAVDNYGNYKSTLETKLLSLDNYSLVAKLENSYGKISVDGIPVVFQLIGSEDKQEDNLKKDENQETMKEDELKDDNDLSGVTSCLKADLNSDKKVDLTDLSIALFWLNKDLNTDKIKSLETSCLNSDKVINLVDISIVLHYLVL